MGYVGVPPQSGFITTAKQRVTSSTNNYVDLDHSISSLADVIVFVNFVKQDYTNLTLTTSSRITLGANLVASDIVEIAYLGKAVATQTPSSGTVTNDMLAGSIANSKLSNSSITLNGSAVSLGGSATVGGDNTPAFSAYKDSADQSLSGGGDVKVQYETEIFDSNGKYDTSNYRFTPTVAGKYFFMASAYVDTTGGVGTLTIAGLKIKKNGTTASKQRSNFDNNSIRTMTQQISCILDLDADDYVEVFAHAETTVGNGVVRREIIEGSTFIGFKLIT